MRVCTLLACLILAACGSSSSSSSPPDAAAMADAAAPSVIKLASCPLEMMPTVTTSDSTDAYMPATTTISAHGIVRFVMSPSHNVVPEPSKSTDSGLQVGLGQTACLEFDKAGSFNFKCSVHGFTGIVNVQ